MTRRQRPATQPASPDRRAHRLAGAVAGALVVLTGPVLPAAAHDQLTGSTPADAATVELPPAAVELTFSEPPLALGSQVQVTGPDGQVVNAGDLVITDTVVSQPLATDLPAGAYSVAWRVTSGDGHPISGELTFTAQSTVAPSEPAVPAAPSDVPAVAPSSPSATVPAPTPDATATTAPDAQAPDPSGTATPWVVGAAVALLAGGALWWALRRRRDAGPRG